MCCGGVCSRGRGGGGVAATLLHKHPGLQGPSTAHGSSCAASCAGEVRSFLFCWQCWWQGLSSAAPPSGWLCCNTLRDAGEIDILDVFRRPEDLPQHLDDILAAKPKAVWLQSGIRNPAFEEQLARAGIRVVADQCLKVVHQMAARM